MDSRLVLPALLGVVYAVILPCRATGDAVVVYEPPTAAGRIEIAPLPVPKPKHVRHGRPIEQILSNPLGG